MSSVEPVAPPRSRTRWIAALAFAVAVVLIAGVAWLLRPQQDPSAVPASSPKEAVTGYLDALVTGDAERALQYALNRPTDTSLLTRAMLEQSHKKAPLAVVDVPEAPGGEPNTTLAAQVTLGERATTLTFSLTRTEEGWRLGQVTSTIDPGALPGSLKVKLNGQALADTAHIEVFPGVYSFTESAAEIDLAGDPVVVDAVGNDVRAGLQPKLTKAGEKKAKAIATASLKACLARRSPAPSGCPNNVTVAKDQKIDTKTIRWTLVGDPWKGATQTLDAADPTQVRGATTLTLRFRCTLTQGGQRYTVDQTNRVNVRYQLRVTDRKEPVVWQRIA
ncbi:MAG: hypothetical protein R2719_05780 [Micropruina sp.]|nr:hypothetical protein [Micropruina sp.]